MNTFKGWSVSTRRLVTDGVLIALFFVLSLFSIEVAGIKLTFDSLPVVLCAMLYGPIDGFAVGFLGALLEQMLRYGFTATTVLWMIPPAVRGLIIGLAVVLMRTQLSPDTILTRKRPAAYFIVCVLAGLVTSCLNTLVYYIDAQLFGYYTYALIFGVFGLRILTGVLSALVTSFVALPIMAALRKTHSFPANRRAA